MLNRWSPLCAAASIALAAVAPATAQSQPAAASPAQAAPAAPLPDACVDAAGHADAVSRQLAARKPAAAATTLSQKTR